MLFIEHVFELIFMSSSATPTPIVASYEVEGMILYHFLAQLSSSNPPSLFIHSSYKEPIPTVQQEVLASDITTIKLGFANYYFQTLLTAISLDIPFYGLSDQENIDLLSFLDLFLQFFTTLSNTLSYYVQTYQVQDYNILDIFKELQQASVSVGGIVSSLKKYMALRDAVGKVITLDENTALNQLVLQFKSAISSFDFIVALHGGPGSNGGLTNINNSIVNFGSGTISVGTYGGATGGNGNGNGNGGSNGNGGGNLSSRCAPKEANPGVFQGALLNMFQTFYGSCGPLFLADSSPTVPSPTPICKPVYTQKEIIHLWYSRPLSLVKRLPCFTGSDSTSRKSCSPSFTVYYPRNNLSSLRELFIPVTDYGKFYLLLSEETLLDPEALGFLLPAVAWSRRAKGGEQWIVIARTKIMMDRKPLPVLVLDVRRNKA